MSAPPKNVLIALGKIPSVDRIKELLGLNGAPVKVKNAFRDLTVDWRKSNFTSDSRPATELLDWNSLAVQKDLRTLAENFLAEKDNAERFWSGTRSWKYDSKLQYPEDRERIVALLVQLFFKQNRYFKNNTTYGQWGHKDTEFDTSPELNTPQPTISSDPTSSKNIESSPHPQLSTAKNGFSTAPTVVDLSSTFGTSPPLEREPAPLPSREIYDGPNDEEPAAGNPRTSSPGARISSKHGRSEQDEEMTSGKQRANYGLRPRNKRQYKDAISDDESEETLKVVVREDGRSTQVTQQSSPHVQRERVPMSTGSGSRLHQFPIQLWSADLAHGHLNDSPEGQSTSGTTPQRPQPRLPSLTSSKSQEKHPTDPSADSSSGISLPSTRNPEGQTKSQSTVSSSCLNPQIGDLSKERSQASPSLHSPARESITVGTTEPLSHVAKSTSPPSPESLHLHQPPANVSSSTEAHTPILSPQSLAYEQIEREAIPHTIRENKSTEGPSQATTELNMNSKAPDSNIPSSKPRPKAHIHFFIITHEPRDTSVLWPEGKMLGASLSDFIAGIAKKTRRDRIESVELTLKTATSDTKIPICKEDEDAWLLATRHFTERLKEARAKAKSMRLSEIAAPEIYVEPFYEQDVDKIEDEEEEFIF